MKNDMIHLLVSFDQNYIKPFQTMIKSLSDALEARELIKVNILTNAEEDAKTTGAQLAEALGADCVAVIGRKAIFYRRSSRKDHKHIEF